MVFTIIGVNMRINSLKELGKGAWKIHSDSANGVSKVKSKNIQPAKISPLAKEIKRLSDKDNGPHGKLWARVQAEWTDEAACEFEGAVPGREFRLDIAMPAYRLAIEVDGWEFHGKYKAGFHKDREKQNLLTENNWKILRFTAKDIYQNLDGCIASIRRTLTASHIILNVH